MRYMKDRARWLWTGLLAPALLAGCGGDVEGPAPNDTVLEPSQAPLPQECRTNLDRLARDFFSQPEERMATDLIRDMVDACAIDDAAGVWTAGWGVLGLIADVDDGDAEDGAALANGVMEYMCAADPDACPNPQEAVVAADLDIGIFEVVGPNSDHVIAGGEVPFVFEGQPNLALWGAQTLAPSWAQATGVPLMAIYGHPDDGPFVPTEDLSFGGLQFRYHKFPNTNGFPQAGLIAVGVCFDTPVELPHVNDNEGLPPLQAGLVRGETYLEVAQLACGEWESEFDVADASDLFAGALTRLAQAFLPEPLAASLMTDREASSGAGRPINFSPFAPVAGNPLGSLVFVQAPQDGTDGVPLPDIVVQALTGEGTPVERVPTRLHLQGNEGLPAGASLCAPGDPDYPCLETDVEFTIETLSGFNTVAVHEGTAVFKPGGYTLCARADPTFMTFTEVCQAIHIKN